MRTTTALRRTAATCGLLGFAAASVFLGASPAGAAEPGVPQPGQAAQAAPYYYDCDNTGPGEGPDSLVGLGCVRYPGGPPVDGILLKDWGGSGNWVCQSVVDTGPATISGTGCRLVCG